MQSWHAQCSTSVDSRADAVTKKWFSVNQGPQFTQSGQLDVQIHSQHLIQYGAHLSHSLFTVSSIAFNKVTNHWIYFEKYSLFRHIVFFKKASKIKMHNNLSHSLLALFISDNSLLKSLQSPPLSRQSPSWWATVFLYLLSEIITTDISKHYRLLLCVLTKQTEAEWLMSS